MININTETNWRIRLNVPLLKKMTSKGNSWFPTVDGSHTPHTHLFPTVKAIKTAWNEWGSVVEEEERKP